MTEIDVPSVVAKELEEPVSCVVEIPGGHGHHTFEVNGEWIVQFARTRQVGEQDEPVASLLRLVEASVAFEVPKIRWSGTHHGLPYVGYRRLRGRPLESTDVESNRCTVNDLADMVRQLHSVDVGSVRRVLGVAGTPANWEAKYRRLQRRTSIDLDAVVGTAVLGRISAAFVRFFDAGFAFEPVFVHGDLGTDHILIDVDTGAIVGLIDFEAANVGDPAVDFVGFIITLGQQQCDQIIDAYSPSVDAGFRQRVHGYWWMGSLYAILHGIEVADSTIVASGLASLHDRLDRLEGLP